MRTPVRTILAVCFGLGAALPAAAQDHDHASPYAAHTDREIKALSQEEIDGLLGGSGMGMALPAEMNGYPGPKHVLELADDLDLTEDQAEQVQRIFEDMSFNAREIGGRIVDLERRLDGAFSEGSVTPGELETLLSEISEAYGRLRFTHLKAHLEVTPLLSDQQRMHYRHLRGYGGHQ